MKFVINVRRRHFYGLLLVAIIIAGANLAIAISSTSAYHPLQDIAKSAGDLTSVDANGNGVIDIAESAQSVPWSAITGKPAGFADDIDNVGITTESDPTVKSWAKTDSPTVPGKVLANDFCLNSNPGKCLSTFP